MYQPYRPTPSPLLAQQHQQQQQYMAQLHALQQQQLALQSQQHAAASSTSAMAWKRAKMAALGFAMGAVVGSTVVGLHATLNRIPVQLAVKSMASTGGAFGTIFAVGTLLRPV